MAETKAGASKATRAKPKAKSKSKSPSAKSRSKPKAKAKPKPKAKAAKVAAKAKAAPKALTNGHHPGKAIGKAKLPLLAGGAALVGAAGGMAYGATRSGAKVLGVKIPGPKRVKIKSSDLAKVAKDVGHFGDRVGELATEIRQVRQGVANGTKDSPVEVLLRGLTKRR